MQTLFDRFHQPLYRYFRGRGADAEHARDLTQEVFVRALRSPAPAEGPVERRAAWLFTTARRLWIDGLRRRARRGETASLDALTPGDASALGATSPGQDLRLHLEAALDALPAEEREALLLREMDGLGYDEIAAATESTRDAVASRIYRARKTLRGELGELLTSAFVRPNRGDSRGDDL